MVRPKAVALTQRELAVMQAYWNEDISTVEEAHQFLVQKGEKVAYSTIANVIRQLADKGYLKQVNEERPFRYAAVRKFEDVSRKLVGDLLTRLFQGSRKALLVQLLDRKKLSADERAYLQKLLNEDGENE